MASRQGRDYCRSPPQVQVISKKKKGAGFDVAAVSFFFLFEAGVCSKTTKLTRIFLSFFFFLEKVPPFSTEDAEERRQRKKEITCVNGAGGKKTTKITKYIKKIKQK